MSTKDKDKENITNEEKNKNTQKMIMNLHMIISIILVINNIISFILINYSGDNSGPTYTSYMGSSETLLTKYPNIKYYFNISSILQIIFFVLAILGNRYKKIWILNLVIFMNLIFILFIGTCVMFIHKFNIKSIAISYYILIVFLIIHFFLTFNIRSKIKKEDK